SSGPRYGKNFGMKCGKKCNKEWKNECNIFFQAQWDAALVAMA
ncbi:hypothetical protein A2U01_0115072, partial [Trifolium medium]|nr:hypothetical protein [Trifolium medium]